MKKFALLIFSFFAFSIVSAQSFNFSNAYIVGTDSVPCVICSIDLYYGKPYGKMETQTPCRYFYISYSYVDYNGRSVADFISVQSWAGFPIRKDLLEVASIKKKISVNDATIIAITEMNREDFNSFFEMSCQ